MEALIKQQILQNVSEMGGDVTTVQWHITKRNTILVSSMVVLSISEIKKFQEKSLSSTAAYLPKKLAEHAAKGNKKALEEKILLRSFIFKVSDMDQIRFFQQDQNMRHNERDAIFACIKKSEFSAVAFFMQVPDDAMTFRFRNDSKESHYVFEFCINPNPRPIEKKSWLEQIKTPIKKLLIAT